MENAATTVGSSRFLGCLGNGRNDILFLGDVERSSDRHEPVDESNVNSSCTENSSESPLSSNVFTDFSKSVTVAPATSSPKKSGRRSVQKRVVSIPMKEIEGSRLKGDSSGVSNTPPSDSWAWRKYGQKPIKGSPYPRGYYRCSSSKGCPARKQVERSRSDPTMLVVTYTGDHNHPWPTSSRSNHHHSHVSSKKPVKQQEDDDIEDETAEVTRPRPDPEHEPLAIGFVGGLHSIGDELIGTWFGSSGLVETTSSAIFPVKTMEEEDESLYADLGELPECSVVFRHGGGVGPQVEIC